MIKKVINKLNRIFHSSYYNIAQEFYDIEILRSDGYHSQVGQDKWIYETLFAGMATGFFVDIGANDGVSLSNTLALEQRGWRGIAFEPNPFMFEKLVENRSCEVVNAAVAAQEGAGMFRAISGYSNMLSGLIDEYDQRHLERIQREIEEHGGEYQDIEIQLVSLERVLEKHNISKVDYLSIDVEGAELQILESIDFSSIDVSALSVENNYNDYRIPRLMNKNGYELRVRLQHDNIYVKDGVLC